MQDKPKNLLFDNEALFKMKTGLDKLANAVKVTLGPRGRNVIIERGMGSPSITKDGVSVAKEVDLKDPFENMGAQLAKDVASKTCDEAGDGTTSATVLSQAIANEGYRVVVAGSVSPVELKRGMDKAVDLLESKLRSIATPADDFKTVARVGAISANNEEEIGEILAKAIEAVGNTGVITIEEGPRAGLDLELIEGMEYEEGMLSPYLFLEKGATERTIKGPVFFLVDKDVTAIQDVIPGIESALSKRVPLVIVCKSMSTPALHQIVSNVAKGAGDISVVRIPGYGDARSNNLRDLATSVGAVLYGEEGRGCTDLREAKVSDMGQAESVKITNKSMTVIGPIPCNDGADLQERIEALQKEVEATVSEYDKDKLLDRIAKLSGAVAVINVGGHSEVETKELRDRVEDAMHATRAAVEEGIVPGGGTALLIARSLINEEELPVMTRDQRVGYDIVMRAIEAPLRNIVINAGKSPDVILDKIVTGEEIGYNARTDTFEDLVVTGVIDPVKVTVTALRNSVSIAGMLLTTSCAITYDRSAEQGFDINTFM